MYNWSVDEEALREHPDAHAIWVLTQQINFGLNGERINEEKLRKYWPQLEGRLDPDRRRYLLFLLHGRLGADAAAAQTS